MMRFNDGCIVETAFGFDHFYQCNLELWGSKGKLAANRIFTAGPGRAPQSTIETNEKNEVLDVDPDNHFVNLLDHFSELIDKKDFSGSRAAILQQARLIQKVKDHASYTRD
ncbi:MAG: hypothetical protein IT223_07035 [Crocinitomicaceae bacterium]|nr:hypothetical protein [Crocinitomicaceae bacterium]